MPFNDKQEEVINTTEGPVMAVSCPGSGKTTVIVERVHKLIENGVNPFNILIITFTKAAAEEMQSRYEAKYGATSARFATIHSICLFILSKAYANDKLYEHLIRSGECKQTIQQLLMSEMKRNDINALTDAVINEISNVKNRGLNINKYQSVNIEDADIFKTVYKEYEQYKKKRNLIDFDDILILTKDLFAKYPQILAFWQDYYKYIMIDEFQDTNDIQAQIFYSIAKNHNNICIVGDDDQSIYGFRAANSSLMLNFDKQFPNCKKIFMDTNYRSCSDVINVANKLIQHNAVRFEKDFKVGRTELNGSVVYYEVETKDMIDKIIFDIQKKQEQNEDLSEIAILYRNNSQSSCLVNRLNKLNIPFSISDTSDEIHNSTLFYDLQTYYALSSGNGQFGDFAKIVNKPTRYIKQKDFAKIKGLDETAIMKIIDSYPEGWQRSQMRRSVRELISDLHDLGTKDKPKQFFAFLEYRMDYLLWLKDWCDYTGSIYADMLDIYKALKEEAMQNDTMEDWFREVKELQRILEEKKKKKSSDDEKGVKLTTFHSSKGLEWTTVYMIYANEGSTPSRKAETDADIEEERRMFYVAMTRAKQNLIIFADANKPISRFIKESGLTPLYSTDVVKENESVIGALSDNKKEESPKNQPFHVAETYFHNESELLTSKPIKEDDFELQFE